jgi:three-Cys-motif partner protein
MSEDPYLWADGAILKEHSKRKHKVLREYLEKYLWVRCKLPFMTRFRLAIVEGFAGGGRYKCGEAGSPVIMLQTIQETMAQINVFRAAEGMSELNIDILMILNDADSEAIEILKTNVAPVHANIKAAMSNLDVSIQYYSSLFEELYPTIKEQLAANGHKSSVLFNLDPCGHSHVSTTTISDILTTYTSGEIFFTFAIQTLISFLQKNNRERLEKQLSPYGVTVKELDDLDGIVRKQEWLGAAEKTVFDRFKLFGQYTSPFSINNPNGWRYWMIHFANSYRARQVFNDVLHDNKTSQAHFGRSGLNMLAYDPREEGALYLFDDEDRETAVKQLYDDIPRAIANYGDTINVGEFFGDIYNETPAHSDDINEAIHQNPDVAVITDTGGERRKANTIKPTDTLKLRNQRSFFQILFPKDGI